MLVRVFIQNEAGSTRKNRHDERTLELLGSEQVSRPYPFAYGFIIGTLASDGMNLDCFVVTQQLLRTGETVACEPLALMEQFEDGVDDTADPEVHDIIEHRGVTVGCQWSRQQPGCWELVRLYLLPEFQGRGIGTHLLTRLSERASSAGLPARLRVLRANPAQRLYGRLGFRIVGETETHLVMERAAQRGDGPDAGWNALAGEPRRSPPT